MATNKVKGNFYCTSYFLLFVLVCFMGSPGPQTTDQTVYPVEEIDEVDRYVVAFQQKFAITTLIIVFDYGLL